MAELTQKLGLLNNKASVVVSLEGVAMSADVTSSLALKADQSTVAALTTTVNDNKTATDGAIAAETAARTSAVESLQSQINTLSGGVDTLSLDAVLKIGNESQEAMTVGALTAASVSSTGALSASEITEGGTALADKYAAKALEQTVTDLTATVAANKTAADEAIALKADQSALNTLSAKVDAIKEPTFSPVDTLPETGESHVIYLVPNNTTGNNVKDEYIYVGSKWEKIGSTDIDLAPYAKTADVESALEQKAALSHTHTISEVTDLQAALDAKATVASVEALTETVGTKAAQSDLEALTSTVSGKADAGHGHAIADVTGLQDALDAKATAASVTELTATVTANKTATDEALATKASAQSVTDLTATVETKAAQSDLEALQSKLTAVKTALASIELTEDSTQDAQLTALTAILNALKGM